MKKCYLKKGNVVETITGDRYLLVSSFGHIIYVDLNKCEFERFSIEIFNINYVFKPLDIRKVYLDYTCKELIWERKEPKEKHKLTEVEKDPCTFSGNVSRDLNLLKAILKKKVNIFDIWRLDTYEEYKKQYRFGTYHAEKDILTKSEFKLLKEVLENEKK